MPNSHLSKLQKAEKVVILEEKARRAKQRKIWSYFPDEGPLRRELYPKHMEFFRAGKIHRERLMLAANRVGKSESVGGYEVTLHLTGKYPDWWEGRRCTRPIRAWAAGDTAKTTRDIIQYKLLGPWSERGTGLIPGDCVVNVSPKQGIAEAAEIITVKHASGGNSQIILKSYDQRREAFQGTEQDLIWLDEEPPMDVYTECVLRTMTNDGMILLTFTPILGMTDVTLSFLQDSRVPEAQVNV